MKPTKLTYEKIADHTSSIIREIVLDGWSPECIVGISPNGGLPARLFSEYFNITMYSLDISDTPVEESTSCLWLAEDAFAGKKILVVDSVNSTGNTFEWLEQDWKSSAYPTSDKWNDVFGNSVRTAVMIDNASSKYQNIDYSGEEISNMDGITASSLQLYTKWWEREKK